MSELEDEAASFTGEQITAFGYRDGCILIALGDGRIVRIGADRNRVWWAVDEETVH